MEVCSLNIDELARLCGVSKKTVSRVINNEQHVSEHTRQRVLAAIREHRYRPSVFARNLGRKVDNTILVSVRRTRAFANANTIWVDQLLTEVIDKAQRSGFRVLIESYYDQFDANHSAMTEGGLVDAVVAFYEEPDDPRIRLCKDFGIPVIVFGVSMNGVSYVSNANITAMIHAYDYLFSRGLTKSCLLLGDRFGTNLDRATGAHAAYRKHGIDPQLLTMEWSRNSPVQVKTYVETVIEQGELPDVFFVSGDQKALGVYGALYDHGLRIPDDVSLIGFDDISISQFLAPPLTTVAQDFAGLAEALIASALQLMDDDTALRAVEVPTRLVVRASTR